MRHSLGAPIENPNGKPAPTADSASLAPRTCQLRAHRTSTGAAERVGRCEPVSTIGAMRSSGMPNAHELEKSEFNRAGVPGRALRDLSWERSRSLRPLVEGLGAVRTRRDTASLTALPSALTTNS